MCVCVRWQFICLAMTSLSIWWNHMCDIWAIKYTKTAYVMLPDWHNDLREMMIQNYLKWKAKWRTIYGTDFRCVCVLFIINYLFVKWNLKPDASLIKCATQIIASWHILFRFFRCFSLQKYQIMHTHIHTRLSIMISKRDCFFSRFCCVVFFWLTMM